MPFDGGMFSVELVLDGPADAAVREDWASLMRAGLPSQGRHTGASNRPHLTLALTATAPEPVRVRLAAIAAELPLRVSLGAVLVFGHRPVSEAGRPTRSALILSRLVVPDRELLTLQRRVVTALDEPVDRHGTFGAGAWTPHVTLGRRFTAAQVAAAFAVLGPGPTPGTLRRLRLWDMSGRQEHWVG